MTEHRSSRLRRQNPLPPPHPYLMIVRPVCLGTRMPSKVGEMIKLLEADDWYLVRVRGGWQPSDTLPPGTERSILKQAGIIRRLR